MKAAICYEFRKPLCIEDIDIAPPQRGELKIRLVATAICHSDIHFIRGELQDGELPMVGGHETAGIVEEVGEDVTLARPGDRVVATLLRSCGRCFYCVTGSPYHCQGTFALDTQSRLRTRGGTPLHTGRIAAFAQYAIVDQSQVVQIPQEMPLDRAALLACGVITGLGAVVNTAQVRPGSTVVVIGTGGVGLNTVQGAVLAGAHQIIAMDIVEKKLAIAGSFGATQTINSGKEDGRQIVQSLTDGRGADYVFVTVGSIAAVNQGLTLLRPEGTLVLVGLPKEGATAPLPVHNVVLSGQKILGSFVGSTRLSVDVPRLVHLYLQGRLKLDELITAHYCLEQINEAIEATEKGEAIRNVIVF